MSDDGPLGPERDGETKFRALFEHSPDAVFLYDDVGTILDANRRASESLGFSNDELVGRHVRECITNDAEDVHARLDGLAVGDTVRFDAEHTTADGSTVPVRAEISRVDLDEAVEFIGFVRDVTEHREREAELERQADRLELFSIAFPDLAFILDEDGRYLDVLVGDRSEELLVDDIETLLGGYSRDFFPQDKADRDVGVIRAAIETGEPQLYEYPLELDGEERWFEARIEPLPFQVDGTDAVVWVARDVTERKARQAELEAVGDRMEFALDSTDTIVFEIDPETHHETRHGPFERIFGLPDAAVDTTERFYERAVHPDDRDAVSTQQEGLFDGEIESMTVEYRTHPEAGEVRWIQSVMTRVDGDPPSIVGLSTDVTASVERRKTLETLHAATRELMAAESPEAIASIGSATATNVLELSINSVNRYDPEMAALVAVAWSEENEALFDGPPPSIPEGDGLVWRALEAGEPRVYDDVREHDDVLNESSPFRSEIHVPVGDDRVMLISSESADAFEETDVALAQILAANMEAAYDRLAHEEELERQNERLEEFASVVSHDLRNPLTVAVGRLELAREAPEDEHFDAMARALDRMERIIQNVLWLAREGRDVGPTEPVDLAETVEGCWRMVTVGGDGEGPSIEIDGELGRIEADEDRLRQALENLLRNAVEHGGEAVSVTVGKLDDGFFVEDDGPGIPEDRREAVFESGHSTSATGTGFGLRIVEQIVEAHGWSIRATAGADGGARFEVTGVKFLGS